jgi:membrane associated rhomboid family serine protease
VNQFSFPLLPRGVKCLIIATAAVWVVQLVPWLGEKVTVFGALVPSLAIAHGQVWRLVTYLFLHSQDPFHIIFNMLALWMFGVEMEEFWGTKRFVTFYFIAGAGAGLFSVLQWDSFIIGASGAILALLTAYAYYFPGRTILIFFIFPVPVRLAVVIIGIMSLIGARSGAGGIAYLTHLGGIAVALLYIKYYRSFATWMQERKLPRHNKTRNLQFRPKKEEPLKPRYFEDVIDPILKKISEKGMDSLTDDERKKLEDASKKPRDH